MQRHLVGSILRLCRFACWRGSAIREALCLLLFERHVVQCFQDVYTIYLCKLGLGEVVVRWARTVRHRKRIEERLGYSKGRRLCCSGRGVVDHGLTYFYRGIDRGVR